MKDRLIVISDMWGIENSQWLIHYTQILAEKFEVVIYDSCKLAGIDQSNCSQDHLHRQFVEGGIDRAVDQLIRLEQNSLNILAFSIGGLIAWKYGIKSERMTALTCVSSTRLRKETERPNGRIELYFGERDKFKPTLEWFGNMGLRYKVLADKGHELYYESEFAKDLSEKIIKENRS